MTFKKPGHGRANYVLMDKGRVFHDPRVDAVNVDLRAGVARDVLDQRMRVIAGSFKAPVALLTQSNSRLVDECHEYKLSRKPYLIDPDGLRQRLHRAAGALGNVSLREAGEKEILMALRHVSRRSRFDVIRAINELLIFSKRPFKLHNPRPPRPTEIAYIELEVFLKRLHLVPEESYRLVLASLFATGCRWGELCVAVVGEGKAVIQAQMDDKGVVRATKNKKGRIAPTIPPLESFILAYGRLPKESRADLRLNHYNRLYGICKRIMGIRLHDLRHSYAVAWGSRGFSTAEIARFIGDTEEVCERHYRNYCATPEEIKRAVARWG